MAELATDNARWLASQHGLRFVDLTQSTLAPGAEQLLPESVARRHHVVPTGRRLGTPVIAVSDPGDLFAMEALRAHLGREFVVVVASADQVSRALDLLYSPSPAASLEPSGNGAAAIQADVPGIARPGRVASRPPGHTLAHLGGEGTEELELPGEAGRPAHHGPNGSGPVTVDQIIVPQDATTLEESLRHVLAAPEVDVGGPVSLAGRVTGEPAPSAGAAPGVEEVEAAGEGSEEHAAGGRPAGSVATEDRGRGATEAGEPAGGQARDARGPGSTVGGGASPEGGGASTEGGDGGEEDAAVASPPPPPFAGPPLARVLVESGRVSADDMTRALEAHQQAGESLARFLYNQGLAKEEDLVWAMAQEVGLEFVDLNAVTIDQVAASLVPEATARHHMVLPIRVENGIPVVAMANPTDVFAMDDLRTIMGRNFTPVVATRSQIAHYLRQAHETDIDVAQVAGDAEAGASGGGGFELENLQAVVEDAPIVRYVNLLILQALNERASDIHVEPTPKRLRIRFRIDGVMHDATSASSSIANAVVSRLKVLGEMDITEHRIPQEGRVSLSVSDRQIDLRLAVLPSVYGETVVMRLLDKSASLRTLPDLGFLPDTLERYAKAYRQPYGVILVTGPTGAGKTTTLYATLAEVLTSEKAVVTVEDPVEYQIDGITQVQINPKAGLTFSTALRSILRADPDIVLIGEIRDVETAKIAMEAALSGHLVLTTLHTNTAAATPLRLTEMGIEPFLVTSAVGSVLTQRLARKLCGNCKEPYDATVADFLAAGYGEADLEGVDTSVLHRAVGCRACSHTGYIGRMVLAEVMNMSEQIDRMIIRQDSIVDIERKACEQGMRTLRQDGLIKAVTGQTTLEEVLRVVV